MILSITPQQPSPTYLGDPGTESEFGVCDGVGAWWRESPTLAREDP